MSLAEIIKTGLDNPECAFFVGSWFGQWSGIRIVIFLAVGLMAYKAIDKLVWSPSLDWIKKKVKEIRKKNKKK